MATNTTVNRIELIGYMGAMPELRYTAAGAPVTNFSLATNRIWQAPDGERRKETDWHRITAWGRLAEVVNTYIGKGKRVWVVGHLEYQSWTDAASGETRSRAVVIASQVLFLDYDRAHTGLTEQPEVEEPAAAQAACAAAIGQGCVSALPDNLRGRRQRKVRAILLYYAMSTRTTLRGRQVRVCGCCR